MGVPLFEILELKIKRNLEVCVGWTTEMGKRQIASPEDHQDLWTSHLGTEWVLGLPDPHLYVQQNH
jgi:hypothetical protein